MKSLITVLLLTVVCFSVYPTVSDVLNTAIKANQARKAKAVEFCNANTPNDWIKVDGSTWYYKCKDL